MPNQLTHFILFYRSSPSIGLAICIASASLCGHVMAADLLEFDTPEQEIRFYNMIEQTRCLVCQNQSLADSDAPLANDLRVEILKQMQTGQTDVEIRRFLVDRYSEFVLYSPPLSTATFVLWFGPLVFVLIGIWIIFRFIKQQKNIPNHNDETIFKEPS